jgi:outer membrane autotransporter protein
MAQTAITRLSREYLRSTSLLTSTTVLAAALGVLSVPASAEDWISNFGDWNNSAKWTPATVPNAQDAVANFDAQAGVSYGVFLDNGTFTVGTLNLNNSVGGGYNFQGGTLVMDSSTGQAQINVQSHNFGIDFRSAQLQLTTDTVVDTIDAATFKVDSIISGNGALTKSGTGTMTLKGVNTYTGSTVINNGVLKLSGTGSLASTVVNVTGGTLSSDGDGINDTATVTNDGTFTITGNETIGGLRGGGVTNLTGAILTTGNASTNIFSGTLSGTGGLTVQGTGKAALSGAISYSGETKVTSGTLAIETYGTERNIGDLVVNGGTLSLDNAILNVDSLAGTGGAVALTTANGQSVLFFGSDNSNTSFSGGVTGDTSLTTLVKQGTGTTSLLGNINTSGSVVVNDGTLELSGSNTFVVDNSNTDATGLFVDGAGRLRLLSDNAAGGATGRIITTGSIVSYANGVNSATPIVLNSNSTQLEVLGTDAATQSGIISELGGARPLEKIGTGKLTLAAPVSGNTFTGDVTISRGILEVTTGKNIGNAAEVKVGNGAKFVVSTVQESIGSLSSIDGDAATSTAKVELNTAANIGLVIRSSNDTTFAGDISGTGQLTVQGGGTLTLTGANSLTGTALSALAGSEIAFIGSGSTAGRVAVIAGGLITTDGGAIASNQRLMVDASTATLTGSETIGSLNGNGVLNFTGTVNLTGAATILTLNGTNGLDSGIAGTVDGTGTLNVTGRTTTVAASGLVNAKTTVGASGTFVNNGSIFDVTSAGTFTNANAVTGKTLISGGTATLNAGSDLSDTLSTTISGGILTFNAADTVGSLIANGGVVNVNETLTAKTFGGTAGSVVLAATKGIIAGDSNTISTFGGVLSGAGYFQKVGTSTLALTGANTFTGGTTISGGTLLLSGSGVLPSSSITIDPTARLLTNGGGLAAAAQVRNDGTLQLLGDETITRLSATNALTLLGDGTAGHSVLTVTGNYIASNAQLGLNTFLGGPGSVSDKLVVGGNVTGITRIAITDTNLGLGAYNPDGIALVEVTGTTTAADFILQDGPISKGLFTYSLALDGGTHELVSLINANAVAPAVAVTGAQSMWADNTDAWSTRQNVLRDSLYQSAIVTAVADPVTVENAPRTFWLSGLGSMSDRNAKGSNLGYEQANYGLIGGADFGTRIGDNSTLFFGVQGGYAQSQIKIADGLNSKVDLDGYNFGAYAAFINSGFFANVLVSADMLSSEIAMGNIAPVHADTTTFGVKSDVGYRFNISNGVYAEPMVSMSASTTSMDSFNVAGTTFNDGSNDLLWLGAGARLGVQQEALTASVTARVWNSLSDDNTITMVPVGPALTVSDSGLYDGTFGEVEGNLNFKVSDAASMFAKASLRFDDKASSAAAQAGVTFTW